MRIVRCYRETVVANKIALFFPRVHSTVQIKANAFIDVRVFTTKFVSCVCLRFVPKLALKISLAFHGCTMCYTIFNYFQYFLQYVGGSVSDLNCMVFRASK